MRNEWDLNPDPVQRSLGAAPAFNAKYPMVQFVGERRSILNGDESPLRKRLRSGNSEAGGGSQGTEVMTSRLPRDDNQARDCCSQRHVYIEALPASSEAGAHSGGLP